MTELTANGEVVIHKAWGATTRCGVAGYRSSLWRRVNCPRCLELKA